MELGVKRDVITTGLAAVIAQRLVRENCESCREPDFPRPMYLKRLGVSENEQLQFLRGAGCPSCEFTGIRGRSGIYEVMEVNRSLRGVLMQGTEEAIRQTLKVRDFKSLTDQAIARILDGTMSVAEAYRTCYFGGGTDAD
jgi:type II secretory ATPase GspE/PulE/Tfp pilus assembly ATPase PilB-like protein